MAIFVLPIYTVKEEHGFLQCPPLQFIHLSSMLCGGNSRRERRVHVFGFFGSPKESAAVPASNFHPPGPLGRMEDWWACAVHSWFLTIVGRGYRLVCNETTHFQWCGVFSVCSPKPLSWERDLDSSSYLEYFMYALTVKRKQRKNTQVLLRSLSGLGFGTSDISHSEYRISRPQTFFSGLSVVRCSGTVEDVGFSGLGVLPET